MEELNLIMEMAEEAMNNALEHLDKSFINIRAGKANPVMLSTVKVDYYGSQTPLSQVANINTPDGQTLSVQPWEKTLIPEIEKAIMVANLGFNPMNNGESFRAFRTPTFACSASALASFTNSRRRSSVSGGMLMIIDSPLFMGLKPKLATIMAFSISGIRVFSQG